MSYRSLKVAALALIVSLALGSAAAAQSPNQLAISAAVPDVTARTVTLTGSNFTERSQSEVRVWINRVPLVVQSVAAAQVVAKLPAGLGSGSYLLEMTRGRPRGGDARSDDRRGDDHDRDDDRSGANGLRYGSITLTIGAVGATGPQGPQGMMGPQGVAGPRGLQGPQGTAGAPGAIGPVGPTGPAGAVGPTGAQGAPGLNGLNGAQGQQGQRGPGGVRGFAEFPYPGRHLFTVPNDVAAIQVEVWGAGGGGGGAGPMFGGGGGGGGGYVKAVLPVTAGEVLGVMVGYPGAGGPGAYTCFPWLGWGVTGGDGGDSGIDNATGYLLLAGGGRGGDGGGDYAGARGGSPGQWSSTFPETRGLLARGGFGGATGGTLGLRVAGGPTPTGSVGLPFGLGGGESGWWGGCPAGQIGNTGMVIFSW